MSRGQEIKGVVHSANASTPVALEIFDQGTCKKVVPAATERLAVVTALAAAAATGDTSLFFDKPTFTAYNITALADGGSGEDTVSIAGEHTEEYSTGRSFTIAGATGNDGTYTSTGATYNATTGNTDIKIATTSLTQVATVDGNITGARSVTAAGTIARLTVANNGGVMPAFVNSEMVGPAGWGVYFKAASGAADAIFTGYLLKV
ncbi:MAG: hypothetical protein IT443_11820 [Phycisphaeraceae bacterium]|nr:hypothetical protein [Phycisphaeraceae bacterium]